MRLFDFWDGMSEAIWRQKKTMPTVDGVVTHDSCRAIVLGFDSGYSLLEGELDIGISVAKEFARFYNTPGNFYEGDGFGDRNLKNQSKRLFALRKFKWYYIITGKYRNIQIYD